MKSKNESCYKMCDFPTKLSGLEVLLMPEFAEYF